MLHMYDFQVWLSVVAFLILKFWKCGKVWPTISKWTNTHQKDLKIQVRIYSAFDLAFLTFVGLFKILLRSLRCEKSGSMQEPCTLAFYHQKEISLKISHFEPVWIVFWYFLRQLGSEPSNIGSIVTTYVLTPVCLDVDLGITTV